MLKSARHRFDTRSDSERKKIVQIGCCIDQRCEMRVDTERFEQRFFVPILIDGMCDVTSHQAVMRQDGDEPVAKSFFLTMHRICAISSTNLDRFEESRCEESLTMTSMINNPNEKLQFIVGLCCRWEKTFAIHALPLYGSAIGVGMAIDDCAAGCWPTFVLPKSNSFNDEFRSDFHPIHGFAWMLQRAMHLLNLHLIALPTLAVTARTFRSFVFLCKAPWSVNEIKITWDRIYASGLRCCHRCRHIHSNKRNYNYF